MDSNSNAYHSNLGVANYEGEHPSAMNLRSPSFGINMQKDRLVKTPSSEDLSRVNINTYDGRDMKEETKGNQGTNSSIDWGNNPSGQKQADSHLAKR